MYIPSSFNENISFPREAWKYRRRKGFTEGTDLDFEIPRIKGDISTRRLWSRELHIFKK